MPNLNDAIQLIRQGHKSEAQQILQAILQSDPKNIQAWFWYVETCSTTEKRIQALEMCLKMNPGNAQVTQALQKFRAQSPSTPVQPEPPKPTPPPVYSYQVDESAPAQNDDLYGYDSLRPSYDLPYIHSDERPTEPYKLDDGYESFKSAPEPQTSSQKKTWEMDPSEYVDNSMLSKSKKPPRSYSVFDVWTTVLTAQDEKSYADILEDPEMGLDRAFSWVGVAGLISALAIPVQFLLDPQLGDVLKMPNIGTLSPTGLLVLVSVAALVLSPLGGMLGLAITGAIQHFLSLFFGGGGNYTRTVYAIAAFLAPMTMITAAVSIIPIVGRCLSVPLGIYNIILNVRALKAAHSLTNGAAIGVVLAPLFLAIIVGCLIFAMVATSLPASS